MSGPFDPSPLDKVTLDKTSIDTSASTINATADENPRFQFSRELKILLGVLALGAAVAGWYVLSGAGTPADTATADIPPATTTPVQSGQAGTGQVTAGQAGQAAPVTPGTEVVPGVTAGTGSAAGSSGSSSGTGSTQPPSVTGGTSGGPVNVAQVPFLNPQGSQGQDPASGAAGTPVGINPEDPLAAVPTSNPFQPLKVVNTNSPIGTGTPQVASTTGSGFTNGASQAAGNPATGTGGSVNTMPVAGAVPLPNVPVAGVSTGVGTGVSSGGVNLGRTGNGTVAGTSGGNGVTSLGNGGAVPLPTISIGGIPARGTGGSGLTTLPGTSTGSSLTTVPRASGTSTGSSSLTTLPVTSGATTGATTIPGTTTGTALPVVPVQPAAGTITPGLSAPSLGTLPLGTLTAGSGAGATGTSGTGTSGTGTSVLGSSLGAGAVGDPSELTASSVQPGLISQYGVANAPVVPAAPIVSALDQLVQSRNLVFNAVVLGPINTAIFKTDQGFVVVPTGQNLPDSTVTLKEVTATSVTLSLGNDSKILELDKR